MRAVHPLTSPTCPLSSRLDHSTRPLSIHDSAHSRLRPTTHDGRKQERVSASESDPPDSGPSDCSDCLPRLSPVVSLSVSSVSSGLHSASTGLATTDCTYCPYSVLVLPFSAPIGGVSQRLPKQKHRPSASVSRVYLSRCPPQFFVPFPIFHVPSPTYLPTN